MTTLTLQVRTVAQVASLVRCPECGVVLCEMEDGMLRIKAQDRHVFHAESVEVLCRRCGTSVSLTSLRKHS